ncbi:T9SS type A sorting domain-containing protein [uncultured Polaribacter sp.]|uniref:T9SS type A sorting domain-containing protein n=1 Tax=uncultured Polaribacter sp. TaxID=174711 RepID=UPI0026187FD5|nr:T9SS type A sorting domain-containing protein [uncultured Polaribacter sp.]
MKKILHKLLFIALLVSCSAIYSQITVEAENGIVAGGTPGTTAVLGSENGGTDNVLINVRKSSSTDNTITNSVTIPTTTNYDFKLTYYKSGSSGSEHDNTLEFRANGVLKFTHELKKNASPDGTATTAAYGTVTISNIALDAGTYDIELRAKDPKGFNIDNYIISETPPSPTMTSTGNGDWNNPDTWTVSGAVATVPSITPTAEYEVVLNGHVVTIPSNMGAAAAKSIEATGSGQLILRQNNTLTVEEDITLSRSNDGMILYAQNGNFSTVTFGGTYTTGKKTTIVKRLSQDKWTLVSSGLSNSKQFKTLDDSRNFTVKVGTKHAFGSYDNTAASGSKYTYVVDGYGTGPTWGSGIGWATKSDENTAITTDTKHDVVFQGDLHSADVPVSLANAGFNLVGNPYPAYLYGNSATADATNNVLTENSSILSEATLWLWDSDNEAWITKNQSSGAYHISPLQGFFVKTNAGSTTFSFTEAMQTHISNSDSFLKTSNNRFSIDLSIESQGRRTSTSINYLENTTSSFDNGYDSSVFGGYSSAFEVYTKQLSGDVNKKLAIQSIPNLDYDSMVIPVGLSVSANSEITFSAKTLNVPTGYKVYLEDRLNNTFTRLDEANAEYTTPVSETSTEGRFYLHTSAKSVLSTDKELLNSVSIYKSNASTLKIVGLSQGKTSVKIYNVLGKKVMSSNFNANGVKEISLPKLSSGVYVVQLETEAGKLNKKIVLE